MANSAVSYDFGSLLSSSERDFLIRANDDKVKIDSLKNKKLGLFFSAHNPWQLFTPILVAAYNELVPKNDFEIVFVSADEDDQSFDMSLWEKRWLAIPFSDKETRDRLNQLFKVQNIPHLVILGEDGKVITENGVEIIQEYGAESYPFTPERIKEVQQQYEEAKRNQSSKSLLVSESRDYLLPLDGKEVPVSALEGKTVGLFFSSFSFKECQNFTLELAEVYKALKEKGENFEIVVVSMDREEEDFDRSLDCMPWLSLPYEDSCRAKLIRYFKVSATPTVVIIGPDGKTLHSNVAEFIKEHGIEAYPFTPEKLAQLSEMKKA